MDANAALVISGLCLLVTLCLYLDGVAARRKKRKRIEAETLSKAQMAKYPPLEILPRYDMPDKVTPIRRRSASIHRGEVA
jgi:hypothetical protein